MFSCDAINQTDKCLGRNSRYYKIMMTFLYIFLVFIIYYSITRNEISG